MTPTELDEWRWFMAMGVANGPRVSGFDQSKDRLMLDHLRAVTKEYRRLVIADERPATPGRQETT